MGDEASGTTTGCQEASPFCAAVSVDEFAAGLVNESPDEVSAGAQARVIASSNDSLIEAIPRESGEVDAVASSAALPPGDGLCSGAVIHNSRQGRSGFATRLRPDGVRILLARAL